MIDDDAKLYTGCLIVAGLALLLAFVAVVWRLVAWVASLGN